MAQQFYGQSQPTPPPGWAPIDQTPDLRLWTWVVHILHALTLVTGFSGLVAVIIAYLRKGETVGTIYESHMIYAIRTFWIGLGLTVGTSILCLAVVGVVLIPLVGIWGLVRIIRPILALSDNRPMTDPRGFF